MTINPRVRDAILGAIALLSFVGGAALLAKPVYNLLFVPTETSVPRVQAPTGQAVTVVATGLKVPWDVAYVPGGDLLITERGGTITRLSRTGKIVKIDVPNVIARGEGGLMGLALHPRFLENGWIYLCQTGEDDGRTINRVIRYLLIENELAEPLIILNGIPGADNHNGCAVEFGPDDKLYVTTGDAGDQASAQDRRSLSGKIVRLNDNGTVPKDNPLDNMIYSYGHRNPQGLAWDSLGRLWATEHGRSGAASGYDELNLILPGKNYGWPIIQGDQKRDGMTAPVINSGPDETWAPSGLAYAAGHLWFAGLRGEALYEASIEKDGRVSLLRAHQHKAYGRLRAVSPGGDGMIYVTTSNTDGRGKVKAGDDRVLRIDPLLLLSEPTEVEPPKGMFVDPNLLKY